MTGFSPRYATLSLDGRILGHFSEGNKHLGYTAILDKLANERSSENSRPAQLAQAKYGDSFATAFGYRRHGVRAPKTKAVGIAKQRRAIHGLSDPFDDDCE